MRVTTQYPFSDSRQCIKALLVLLVVVIATGLSGQNEQLLKFRNLNIQDGLISPVVTDMEEDQQGFLWISTFSGLSRFDGTEFTNYYSSASPCGLVNSHISNISVGPDSNVYMLAGDSWSLLDVQRQCFHHVEVDTTFGLLPSQFLQGILADTGIVWFGTDVGVAKYDLSEETYTHYLTPPNKNKRIRERTRVRHMVQHPSDPNRLILAITGGLCYFHKKEGRFEYSIPLAKSPYWGPSLSRSLHVFDTSTYWNGWWANSLGQYDVGSQQWTVHYTPPGMRHIDPGLGNVPYDVGQAVLPYDQEYMLAGFDRGLGILSLTDGVIRLYQHDPNDPTTLSNNDIVSLIRTESQVIYVGTSNGLSVLEDNQFGIERYNPRDYIEEVFSKGLQDPALIDMIFYCARVPISNHELLYSDAVTGGLTIVDFSKPHFQHLPMGKEGDQDIVLYDWTKLPNGNLLFGSDRNLLLFNPQTRSEEPLPDALEAAVRSRRFFRPNPIFMPDGNIVIWDIRHILRVAPDGSINPIQSRLLTGQPLITWVHQDPQRELIIWLGAEGFRMQADSLEPLNMPDPPETRVVCGFVADSTMWLGTSGAGLYQFHSVGDSLIRARHYTTQDGLPSNDVSRLTPITGSTLWGSTLSGVFRLDIDNNYIRAYDLRDGVDLPYIDEPPVVFPDGSVVFDDRKYLYRLLPENQREQSATAYIQALGFPDSTYFDLARPIELPPNQNSVTIEMGIIDHVNGPRDELYYWLEGFDDKWNKTGGDRNVRYTNLRPGTYRIKVRSRDLEGHYSEPVYASFVIRPALHQRTWFIPLCVLLAFGAIYFWYRTRLDNLKQTEQLRTQHNKKVAELELKALRSQMNPHFMFNSLNSIKNYILQAEPAKASEYLSSFAHLIRLTLQYSREKSISLKDELEALILYIDLEKLRFRNGFDFHCTIDDRIDLEHVTIPPMILQPYVENAIWHGLLHKEGERQLSINFDRVNGLLHCSIEDNGIGREKANEIRSKSATRYKSMGMGITRDRVDILNQISQLGIEIDIIDKKDALEQPSGTRVDIKIPYESNPD